MSDKSIKFTIDSTQAKRALGEIGREVAKISKPQKLKIDVDDTRIRDAISFHQDVLSTTNQRLKQLAASEPFASDRGRANIQRERAVLMKDKAEATARMGELSGGGGSGGGLLGAAGGILSRFGLPLTIGAGALAYAGRVKGGIDQAEELAGNYVKMRGMGFGMDRAMPLIAEGATRRGIGADTTREMMMGLLRGTGSVNSDVLRTMQTMHRGYGLDAGLLTNVAGAVRQTGAAGDELAKRNAEILASAISSHLERGRLAEYLQITASTIEQFSSQVAGLHTGPLANMMGLLTGQSGIFTPSFSAGTMTALDQMIRSPSTKQAPLLFNTLAQTLTQGGYRGNLALGMQALQTTGLGTPNLNPQMFPNLAASGKLSAYQGLYGAFSPVDFLKNLAKNVTAMGGTNPLMQGIVGSRFGLRGGAPAVSELLEMVQKPSFSKDEAEKWMKNFGPQSEKSLNDVNTSIEGNTKSIDNLISLQKEMIGTQLLPEVNAAKESLAAIEGVLVPLLKPMVALAKISTPLGFMTGFNSADKTQAFKEQMYKKYGVTSAMWHGATDPANDTHATPDWWRIPGGGRLSFKSNAVRDRFAAYAQSAPQLYQALVNSPMDMFMTSSSRTWAENMGLRGVGSSLTSKHLSGQAVDLRTKGYSNKQITDMVTYLRGQGLSVTWEGFKGNEQPHLHVSQMGTTAQGPTPSPKIHPHDIVSLQH